MVGSCEHGNECFDSTESGEFLEELSDCQLLKKTSTLWHCLISY
jgi:hypothetical protein